MSETYENDSNDNNLDRLKERSESFYEEKLKGVIILARARWHEHSERSTKYFLNLEKTNHVKKHMQKLNINDSMTADALTITSEQKRFYQQLYTCYHGDDDEVKNFLNVLKLQN